MLSRPTVSDQRHRQAAGRPDGAKHPEPQTSPEPYKGKGIKYNTEVSSARKARPARRQVSQIRFAGRSAWPAVITVERATWPLSKEEARLKRHHGSGTAPGTGAKPRLTVYKSLNHIYAQLVDARQGRRSFGVDLGRNPHDRQARRQPRSGQEGRCEPGAEGVGQEDHGRCVRPRGYRTTGCIRRLPMRLGRGSEVLTRKH